MEIGLYTFADMTPDPDTGVTISVEQRYREILQAVELAEAAGLAVFGFGEHHRLDLPISSPAVMMAAAAARTKAIHLTSAVTILSTLDPVRVFEDFASVDLISGGRAELIAGRGAFVESFSLFGYDLDDYKALFEEKLALLLALKADHRVTWDGMFRSALDSAEIAPRPVEGSLPIWIGTGGNPDNAAATARLGLPLTLANITRPPAEFARQIADYKRIGADAGYDSQTLRVALAGHMHIETESQSARDHFYPRYAQYFLMHAPRQAYATRVSEEEFAKRSGPQGPLFVGSPQEIIDKMMWEHELFGHQRFLAQIDIGGLSYAKVAKTIELLGSEVLPVAKDL